ncbi:MAG: hypothetical protein COW84_07900 [Gammaproteobacteria bacterium CG22_combo_CG10-13_8_21_14_all_40_8]|nr:MAG: hypothetical protein COW84_07900 [Gammaproteobacteria bacterium CG22_combo_CG10-13_8_21_14_all_40_8]
MPTSNAFSIREYQSKDFEKVIKGLLAIDETERLSGNSLPKPANFKNDLEKWLQDITNTPSSLIIIAEKSHTYCGFVLGMIEFQPQNITDIAFKGIIQAIWIEPEYRRTGIATLLVNEMMAAFAEHQIPFCDVSYEPNNINALKFWQSLGFIPTQVHTRKKII